MKCSSCGTYYEPTASGVPYCPNNNCPMHQAASGPSNLRQEAAAAMKEAEMWTQAVKDAEQHLADTRSRAQAAQADVIAKLEAAKRAAAEEAEAISLAARDYAASR